MFGTFTPKFILMKMYNLSINQGVPLFLWKENLVGSQKLSKQKYNHRSVRRLLNQELIEKNNLGGGSHINLFVLLELV